VWLRWSLSETGAETIPEVSTGPVAGALVSLVAGASPEIVWPT